MASACSKINEKENQTSSQTITCIAPNDGTKSYVDGLNVKWQDGDEVIVIEKGYTTEAGNAYYTLSSGANTTSAEFKKTSGKDIDKGADVTAFSFKKYFWVGNKYYYDIPNNPELVAYSASNDSPVQQYVPMIAKNIKMGKSFVFEHLASVIRLKITNSYSAPVTIKTVEITSEESTLSSRRELNPATDWSEITYSKSGSNITSSGNVVLEAGKTKIVDFIVSKEPQTNLKVTIITTDDNRYIYKKSSFKPVIGKIHSFETSLNEMHHQKLDYSISIDGADPVPYGIGQQIPLTSTTGSNISIALKSNPGVKIDNADLTTFIKNIKELTTVESIDVDLRGVETRFTEFPSNIVTALGSKLKDFYLPLTVTTLPTFGKIVTGCTNAKLHIHKDIKQIGWVQWGGPIAKSGALNAGAGFFVDKDNPNYSSKDGVLYSKDGLTMIERIAFKTDDQGSVVIPDGVITLDTYALSNHQFVKSYTFPSSLKEFKKDVLTSTKALVELVFKSKNPPTLGCALNGNQGWIIIDTGDPKQDNESLVLYQKAWGTMLGTWRIKTKEGVEANQNAVITNLSSKDEYSSKLW